MTTAATHSAWFEYAWFEYAWFDLGGADQVDRHFKVRNLVGGGFTLRAEAQTVDSGSCRRSYPISHHVFGTDHVGSEYQFLGNSSGGGCLVAFDPQALYFLADIFVAGS